MQDWDDSMVVNYILKGHPESFREIMNRYGDLVYRMAYRRLNSHEDAADLSQDIFFHIYKVLKKYDPKYKFFSWLYRITLNMINSELRKKRSGPEFVKKDLSLIPDNKNSPLSSFSGRLDKFLEDFPDGQKEIFHLFYADGYTVREISQLTGESPSNVKIILFRIRNKIKEVFWRGGLHGSRS
ncbi:MAG TPA: sigma-70 family RNA polymerase sigma factor [Firmicutes bacterium]|nr:sigma-70 family RNA polymerase sigma factor [Bacillota bacterium]